jgi:hypothetical protein
MELDKNDYIVEIITTMVRLGIDDNENFVEYITTILPKMNTLELKYELENVQDYEISINGSFGV